MPEEVHAWTPIDKHDMAVKGEAILKAIEGELLPEHRGKAVVIDVDSGDYFVGETGIEATDKAREKHPGKIFYLARIGARAYVSFKGLR